MNDLKFDPLKEIDNLYNNLTKITNSSTNTKVTENFGINEENSTENNNNNDSINLSMSNKDLDFYVPNIK